MTHLVLLFASVVAWAQESTDVSPSEAERLATGQVLEGPELLRALSLDLRGVVPTMDEYAAVADGSVDDVVDAWLDDPAFAERVVQHHRSLLWNNVGNVRLAPNRSRITQRGGVWFRNTNSTPFRGRFNQGCSNRDAVFDDYGWPVAEEVAPGIFDEGAVWVAPYWDPDTEVRVCAYDAMAHRFAPDGTDCAGTNGQVDEQCGCGPELSWCFPATVERDILASMGADIDARVRAMVLEDQSYLDLLTGDTAYIDGPLAHFLQHQTLRRSGFRFDPPMVDAERLPDLAYGDGAVAVPLGDHHSGVLTAPGWLLRFQTQRSRANQFHNSFLCQPFIPPSSGLPQVADVRQTLDLTERDGCQYCHALLEPAAAHWGRWAESGAAYLDPDAFPEFDPACEDCATRGGCTDDCRSFYVTRRLAPEQDPFIGYLNSYEFLEERHTSHVEEGPALLVHSTIADGRLPECVAEKAATWLLGRAPTAEEEPWVESLAAGFVTSGLDYKQLIRDIVTSENYRRLP